MKVQEFLFFLRAVCNGDGGVCEKAFKFLIFNTPSVSSLKWIEINVDQSQYTSNDDCLLKVVRPALDEARARVQTWHFLWEGRPWPSTLRLRFYGNDEDIEKLKQFLEHKLKNVRHCYGEHGDCSENKEYKGEANGGSGWGTKAWEKGMKFLEIGSEFALELIENKDKLGRSPDYKKNADEYADRYTHLFLNQISSLVNEVDFDLSQGIFRYGYETLQSRTPPIPEEQKIAILSQIVQPMINEAKQRIQARIQALMP